MTVVIWERFPLLAEHDEGRRWLQFLANIGRAANTVDAYGRAVEDLQRTLTAAYRKADYFARNVRTIQVLIDRESILTGTAAGGKPWKYYDLGDGYCSYDFFAKCPHRLACARCPFYLPKQSHAGQLLAVKTAVEQMLEQVDLTDEERAALEGDRDALTALTSRLADMPTPAGPTPKQLGTDVAFIPLTTLIDSLTSSRPPSMRGKDG